MTELHRLALLALLKLLEWREEEREEFDGYTYHVKVCPVCAHKKKFGHEYLCELAGAIAALETAESVTTNGNASPGPS